MKPQLHAPEFSNCLKRDFFLLFFFLIGGVSIPRE